VKTVGLAKIVFFSAVITLFSGCGIKEYSEYIKKEKAPFTADLPNAYGDIAVKRSTSAEVLDRIKRDDIELISQSESVVACWGEKKKDSQFWLTAVAFDEESFTAWRKYFLTVDERARHLFSPGQKMLFQTEQVMGADVLGEPYSNANEKQIAIIEAILENVRNDITAVSADSRVLSVGDMMLNQTIERIIYILKKSPALAARLGEYEGLFFDHMTLGPSRVKLNLYGDTVTMKIKSGRVKKTFGD